MCSVVVKKDVQLAIQYLKDTIFIYLYITSLTNGSKLFCLVMIIFQCFMFKLYNNYTWISFLFCLS